MYYSWHMYYLSLVCIFIINLCFIIDSVVVLLLIRRIGKAVLWPFEDTWCFSDWFSGEPGSVSFLPNSWMGDTEAREGQGLFSHISCPWDVGKGRWWDWGNASLGSMSWADNRAKCIGSCRMLRLGLPVKSPSGPACPRLLCPSSHWGLKVSLLCLYTVLLCAPQTPFFFLFLPGIQLDYISQPPLQFGGVMWLNPGRGIWLPGLTLRNLLCHPPHPLSISAAWMDPDENRARRWKKPGYLNDSME